MNPVAKNLDTDVDSIGKTVAIAAAPIVQNSHIEVRPIRKRVGRAVVPVKRTAEIAGHPSPVTQETKYYKPSTMLPAPAQPPAQSFQPPHPCSPKDQSRSLCFKPLEAVSNQNIMLDHRRVLTQRQEKQKAKEEWYKRVQLQLPPLATILPGELSREINRQKHSLSLNQPVALDTHNTAAAAPPEARPSPLLIYSDQAPPIRQSHLPQDHGSNQDLLPTAASRPHANIAASKAMHVPIDNGPLRAEQTLQTAEEEVSHFFRCLARDFAGDGTA